MLHLKLIKGSYLTLPFERKHYDYVVSSMTMHHFVPEAKLDLYKKIREALKQSGKYIEGDYIVSKEEETKYLDEYYGIMNALSEEERGLYHIDSPMTLETQKELLNKAGVKNIEIIWHVEKNHHGD